MGFTVPAAVERLLTADVAAEIARTFGDQPVYPQRIVVNRPLGSSPAPPGSPRRFPGWPGPVLVLSDENQGVCSWGVPADGSGWLARVAPYRFEDRDVQVMLWSQAGQCDWWVSAASPAALRQFAPGLPGLRQGLWSNDEDGERLLSEARRLPR